MLASRVLVAAAPGTAPFVGYLRLELKRSLRNRRYLLFTVGFPALIYLLYTAVLPAGGPGTKDGLTWPAFFMVSMAAYGAMGAAMSQAVPIATERRNGWVRQLRVTPLSGAAYVTAKVVTALALTVPALLLVAAVATLANHVDLGGGRVWVMVAVLALGSIPFAALGLVIGYLLDAESAQGGMVLAYFSLAILGGLFAPTDAFPAPLATIAGVLPSSHLAALGRAVAAGSAPAATDVLVLAAWTIGLGALAAWRYLRDERAGRA